jgi:protein ImuB
MGHEGLRLQRLARGVDALPLVPDPGTPRFLQSIELEWPIDALEPLSFVLARLLDPLAEALERADRGAAAVRLDLRLVDRSTFARVLQLPAAMRDPKVLRTLLLLDLESHPPPAAIDIVTIEIDPAPARIIQYSLLERAMPSAETLATLSARLCALVGDTRCGSPVLLDTYRPDAIEMRRFAPEARPSRDRRRGKTPHAADAEQVLPPGVPAPADAAAPLQNPEGRGSSPESRMPVLRRFRPPIAVRVAVERGRPVRVAIDRRGMPGGDVEQQAGPWRTSGAWWDAGVMWDRDEWEVALSDGSLCRLFHDRVIDRWFLEGVFD